MFFLPQINIPWGEFNGKPHSLTSSNNRHSLLTAKEKKYENSQFIKQIPLVLPYRRSYGLFCCGCGLLLLLERDCCCLVVLVLPLITCWCCWAPPICCRPPLWSLLKLLACSKRVRIVSIISIKKVTQFNKPRLHLNHTHLYNPPLLVFCRGSILISSSLLAQLLASTLYMHMYYDIHEYIYMYI